MRVQADNARNFFLLIFGYLLLLMPGDARSQAPPHSSPRRLTSSTCSNAHGWMTISIGDIAGDFSCFSPQISKGYASIGAGAVNGRNDIGLQMDFLSRPGTHSCRVPMVIIEFQEKTERWDAYRVRNGQFGECTITQAFEDDHKVWKGHVTGILVMVKGDTASGSPRYLHSQKDRSGKPLTRKFKLEWEFDRLFSLDPRSTTPPGKN